MPRCSIGVTSLASLGCVYNGRSSGDISCRTCELPGALPTVYYCTGILLSTCTVRKPQKSRFQVSLPSFAHSELTIRYTNLVSVRDHRCRSEHVCVLTLYPMIIDIIVCVVATCENSLPSFKSFTSLLGYHMLVNMMIWSALMSGYRDIFFRNACR